MPLRHARIFPRASFHCVLAGLAAIGVFCAMVLVPDQVHLLPYLVTPDFVHFKGAFFILLLAVGAALYLVGWKGSDFFAWWVTPRLLTVGSRGLQVGERSLAFADVTRFRRRHGRNHLLFTGTDGRTLRVRLDLWERAPVLLAEVEEAIGEVMRHGIERRVHAGETVSFGALSLHAEGLVHQGQLIAWSSIDSVRTQCDEDGVAADEHLVIVALGRTRRIDRSKIDNEPVLLACLLQRLPAD